MSTILAVDTDSLSRKRLTELPAQASHRVIVDAGDVEYGLMTASQSARI